MLLDQQLGNILVCPSVRDAVLCIVALGVGVWG